MENVNKYDKKILYTLEVLPETILTVSSSFVPLNNNIECTELY